ncbi:MAG: hypothetical protein HY721_08845 [Planctomycetes bacterium]|nr:hypothetical protein [Planctomycetota bacterium]
MRATLAATAAAATTTFTTAATTTAAIAAVVLAAVLPGRAAHGQVGQRVKDTVHNLSASGPGQVRAQSETEVCIFCHTPHGSAGVEPLWNRSVAPGPYLIYQSTSLRAQVGQPTGASKLCLSCHDGTIALGSVLSRPQPIAMAGSDRMPAGPTNLGTDLSDDHPVSFSYASSLAGSSAELVQTAAIPAPVTLDKNGEVQCTSCHEPHDNSYGDFLARPNVAGALCTSCHRPLSWTTSGHATSSALVSPDVASVLEADAASVAQNACKGCHQPHGAAGKPWILHRENISATCVPCHDGTVAGGDVRRELGKPSSHGIVTEGPPGAVGGPYLEGPMVSCADCHDPHAAGSTEGLPAGLPASLARVPGVALNGTALPAIRQEHELCFRCHGDAPARVDLVVSRVIVQPNKRLQFQPTNPSFHPVGNPGANSNVPSLLPPLTTSSVIACGDCHASDDTRRLGGTGPAGPHGSVHDPLLALRCDTLDYSVESPAAYALCYRCHQRDSILGDRSFEEHKKHVVDAMAPCSACHDPHGISSAQGTAQKNSHLINFDRSIVFPNSAGRLEFIDLGTFRGQCYLTCHGEEHNPEEYGNGN